MRVCVHGGSVCVHVCVCARVCVCVCVWGFTGQKKQLHSCVV